MRRLHRTKSFIAAVALMLTLAISGVPPALAGTPSSGTLSLGTPAIGYVGGPFVVAVQDPILCVPTTCDDFALTVSVPAGYQLTHNVRVVVGWTNKVADFDLYILDAAGTLITSSSGGSEPEVALFSAASGNFTIHVVPYNPLGESFSATIDFQSKSAVVTGPAAQRYRNYPSPATMGNRSGEPSIGANWRSGSLLFQASFWTLKVTNFDPNSNQALWEDRTTTLPSCLSELSLDPIGFVDSPLGRTFQSQLLANPALNSETCYTDDDGLHWTQSQGGGPGQGIDHQTIGGGPYKPNIADATGKVIGPTTAYPHAVYYCSQMLVYANCSRSDDGGRTFGPSVIIYTAANGCGGLHGHVKVAPNGTVYVPNKGCNGEQGVVVSTDNGRSWTVRSILGSTPHKSDPSVGLGANGTVYFGYSNNDGSAHVAVSRDEGRTWTDDHDVSSPVGLRNTLFAAVVAGDDDRAAYAFLGTTTPGDYESSNFSGTWQLYVAHTYDGGKTWATTTVDTPNDPVQVGCIWLSGGSNDCRNLLDFMDATVDAQGLVNVGYPDGCTKPVTAKGPTCVDQPATKKDTANGYKTAKATIGRQMSGRPLFARFDPKPDLTVTDLRTAMSSSQVSYLTATVANIGLGDATTSFVVRFTNGTTVIGEVAVPSLAAGTSRKVTVRWGSHLPNGVYTITATADAANVVVETNEANNFLTRSFTITNSG